MSVHYEMPKSSYTHKSMLLRGVKFGTLTLDRADIEATKGRANHSGRSHGGAPLRGGHNNGRGRGSQMNYSDSRPNPFAAHINPGFAPSGISGNSRGGPPPPPMPGWAPPPPGSETLQRGPPPPHGRNPFSYAPQGQSYNYGAPQVPLQNGYGNRPPQPPPSGQYMNNYPNHAPNDDYYRPPTGDRYGGYNDRTGR